MFFRTSSVMKPAFADRKSRGATVVSVEPSFRAAAMRTRRRVRRRGNSTGIFRSRRQPGRKREHSQTFVRERSYAFRQQTYRFEKRTLRRGLECAEILQRGGA